MNEICIVYDSPHKGNTEKLLLKIKEKYADTALVKAADCTPEFFSRYDVLGFASGIYYGKFSPSVSAVFEQAIKSDVKKSTALNGLNAKTLAALSQNSGNLTLLNNLLGSHKQRRHMDTAFAQYNADFRSV